MTWIEQQIDRLMRGLPAGFGEILSEALRQPETLVEAIEALEEVMLESADDGYLTVQVLRHLPLLAEDAWNSPLHTVMNWIEEAEPPAAEAIAAHGLPELVRIYDELWDRIDDEDDDENIGTAGELLTVLRIMLTFRAPGTLTRLASATQHPVVQNAYLWSTIFDVLDAPEHPWRVSVARTLQKIWPAGYAQAAFLAYANARMLDGELESHPFDSVEGHACLQGWLTVADGSIGGAARAAASALPFIDPTVRTAMLKLAESHVDITVRIEAAAARALDGDAVGLARLRRWSGDPRYAELAIAHLQRMDALDMVPDIARDRNFQAASTMASWLSQPSEFGRPPDDLEAVDSRKLNWPPTQDRRRVWLFRYRYWPMTEDDHAVEGVGMVGSVTFAMADEDTETLTVAEAYGLHCAWELEMLDDPRTPSERTPQAGLQILRAANPDL